MKSTSTISKKLVAKKAAAKKPAVKKPAANTFRHRPHTPGPWKVSPTRNLVIAPEAGERGTIVAEGRCHDLHTQTHNSLTAEANAALIASAPELLAALRGLRDALNADPSPYYMANMRAAEAKAKDAIDKAEGR